MGCDRKRLPVDMLTAEISGWSSGESSAAVLFSTCMLQATISWRAGQTVAVMRAVTTCCHCLLVRHIIYISCLARRALL